MLGPRQSQWSANKGTIEIYEIENDIFKKDLKLK